MGTVFQTLCLLAMLLVSSLVYSAEVPLNTTQRLMVNLYRAAPDLKPQVLKHALSAMRCAVRHGARPAQRLAVIDFSLPSSEQRLWIFDLHKQQLLLQDFVAHGRESGENWANKFSNQVGSHQSSIGLFRTQESYRGRHGYSLRVDGLEPGINDRARERAIVIHGADYVDPYWVSSQGRIGRSLGCPAVRQDVARMVVDSLKDGQFLFSWYPDQQWLQTSAFLNCDANQVASILTSARSGGQGGLF